MDAGHPFVVAHRGASGDRPEHTLAAYELALQEGADGVECDVRLTRDGHLVCESWAASSRFDCAIMGSSQ